MASPFLLLSQAQRERLLAEPSVISPPPCAQQPWQERVQTALMPSIPVLPSQPLGVQRDGGAGALPLGYREGWGFSVWIPCLGRQKLVQLWVKSHPWLKLRDFCLVFFWEASRSSADLAPLGYVSATPPPPEIPHLKQTKVRMRRWLLLQNHCAPLRRHVFIKSLEA